MYYASRKEAVQNGDADIWAASRTETKSCATALEALIKEYDHIPRNEIISIIFRYGLDRASFVLSSTILNRRSDFHEDQLAWALEHRIVADAEIEDISVEGSILQIESLLNELRQIYRKLGLYELGSCLPNSGFEESSTVRIKKIKGKIYVVKPTWLSPEFQKPQYQIFQATARKSMPGTVIGRFLFDNEVASIDFDEILGELKPELYPAWLVQKLEKEF